LQIIVCLFVRFHLVIVLSIFLWSTASGHPYWYLQTFLPVLYQNNKIPDEFSFINISYCCVDFYCCLIFAYTTVFT
jgi:hypothetical protein